MRHLAIVAALLAVPAVAEEMPVVVELFTSQGCSACPPADAILAGLAELDGVIALSLHVDYWDYLGWPDSLAQPAFSARQEAYARAAGERMVYTPQIVMNGADRMVGGDAMAVMERLRAHSGVSTPVDLRLTRDGATLRIEAQATGPLPPLSVHLVRVRPFESVTIEKGENAGLTMDYRNVVAAWDVVGRWDGAEPLRLDAPLPGPEPAVVLLQEDRDGLPGRIVAAARVD